jgi:hypothetical protein
LKKESKVPDIQAKFANIIYENDQKGQPTSKTSNREDQGAIEQN